MSKPKGKPKTGGRQKGTPNKVTSTLRNWILDVFNCNREQLASDMKALDAKDRLLMFEKLLPYILPKVTSAKEVEGAAFTKADKTYREQFEWGSNDVKDWYE